MFSSPELVKDNEEVTCAIHLKSLLPPWSMKGVSPSTVQQKSNYPVENVWRQIQGPLPCHSSVLGVLSQSPCLRKSPMIVRANGKT